MTREVSESIGKEILKMAIYPDFRFTQEHDDLTNEAIKSLVIGLNGAGMPIERAIVIHRAVLLSEVIRDGQSDNIRRILDVFKSIKAESVIRDYLMDLPDKIPGYTRRLAYQNSLSAPEVQEKVDKLRATINKFLEQ